MIDIEKEDEMNKSLDSGGSAGSTALIKSSNDLTEQIINENDPDKLNDLTNLFAINQKKKDIARTNRLSNLLEIIDDEVIMRFTSCPESFDHDQVLNYMKATQQAISNIQQNMNQTPLVQINNQSNEIHIDNSGLDRSSREKVLNAVNEILNNIQHQDVIDVDIDKVVEND